MAGDGKSADTEPHWQWPVEFYYGGEVIEENRKSQDTLRVALYKQGSEEKPGGEDKLVGDTGKFPLRYLVDGRKRATVKLNLTSFSFLTGVINVEVQQIKRNQPANRQAFEPGCLKVQVKELELIDRAGLSDTSILVAKVDFQGYKSFMTKSSRP